MTLPISFSDGLATVSLVISLWSAYYSRKNYLASTYPRCHVSPRLVNFDGVEGEKPPHHLKIDVRNLHPQISMSNVEVKLYVSEPTIHVRPRYSWGLPRTKWLDLMKCTPISVIEPTQLVTFEPVNYEVNILEDAICVRLPQYLALVDTRQIHRNLEDMRKTLGLPMDPPAFDNRARWYQALMRDYWLRIRVEVTYTPGSTGSRRYKRELIWALQPKADIAFLNGWVLLQLDPTRNPYTGETYGRH